MKRHGLYSRIGKHLEKSCSISCFLCQDACSLHARLCNQCLAELPVNCFSCFCCAEPLEKDDRQFFCGTCQQNRRSFWRTVAPLLYESSVAVMLKMLKYQKKLAYANPLAKVLTSAVQSAYQEDQWPQAMVPMPLHAGKLYQRGYNQAGVIANHLSRHLSLPVDRSLIRRIKETDSLAGQSSKERRRSLQGAFKVKVNGFDHIALIDDIVTSTASAEAAAGVLRQSGISRVDVWSIARTP